MMQRSRVMLGTAALSFLAAGCYQGTKEESTVQRVFGATGLGSGEFSYPRAIAVSPVDGGVFIIDKTARVQRFSRDGAYEAGWRMPEWKDGKPTGVYVDRHNAVWVADTHYHRVISFDRDGREQMRFGEKGEGPGQFCYPTSVVRDRDDFIFVGEYSDNETDRISKFTPEGRFVAAFADKKSGAAWVQRPTGLSFDESNVLWVADACHHRICRYDRGGRFLGAFGSAGSEGEHLNYPYDLALERSDTLVVADRGNNRIARFNRSGKFLGSWGTPGRGRGQLSQPWGVAVGADGLIYVLDSWNNRVQVIKW